MKRVPLTDHEHGTGFWVGLGLGGLVMAFGAIGLVRALDDAALRSWLVYFIGADVVHDVVVAPLACLVGVLCARLLPPAARAPVQAGLIASAVVLFVGYAPLRGTAAVTGNPTIQPLDYTTAVLTVLGVVWGLAAVWLAVRLATGRPRRASASASASGG